MYSYSIEISELSKSFKNIKAVDNLSLSVKNGDIFGFLGPNGAGKSTTIRMMLSLIKPDNGLITYFGINNSNREIYKKIGALVEKPDFYLYLSALRNLKYFGALSGADVSNRNILKILNLVGLEARAHSKVKTYSLGMKQRLGIAQALLHNPDILIFDEPTNGLDPIGMKEVRDLILKLAYEDKKTIFLSSHILKEVESIATEMAIINKGKTIVQGKTNELINNGDMKVTFEFNQIDNAISYINQTIWSNSIIELSKEKIVIRMSKDEIPNLIKKFVENDIEVSAVIPLYSLEDYFIDVTQRDNHD